MKNLNFKIKRGSKTLMALSSIVVALSIALSTSAATQVSAQSISSHSRPATQAQVQSQPLAAVSDVPLADLRENRAAPAVVQMKSLAFEPKVIQVEVAQPVIWKNVSFTPQSATGDVHGEKKGAAVNPGESSFDTGLIEPKHESKPLVFMTPGSYPYHCSVHGKTMSGVVIVKGKM